MSNVVEDNASKTMVSAADVTPGNWIVFRSAGGRIIDRLPIVKKSPCNDPSNIHLHLRDHGHGTRHDRIICYFGGTEIEVY